MPLPRQLFLDEAKARIDAALDAEIGFVERLVWFWSNHFCVNADKTVMAGGYEREAIRPHVLGRFGDMLLAAEGHPAMLLYLDNAQSIGPNSVAGINRDKGLNENLAREILELHTLGVRTRLHPGRRHQFRQGADRLDDPADRDRTPITAANSSICKRAHEPGPQTVIGQAYPDAGAEQGRAVLADLARHPATARHVATKLARHFIADDPPPALVERLTQRFLDTDGDLKEVAKALIDAPEAWAPKQAKIKRPGEWIVAALRATGLSRRHRAHRRRDGAARRAAVAAAGAEGLLRRQRGLARRPGAAARHRQHLCAAGRRRPRPRGGRRDARSARSPRRKPAAPSPPPRASRRR